MRSCSARRICSIVVVHFLIDRYTQPQFRNIEMDRLDPCCSCTDPMVEATFVGAVSKADSEQDLFLVVVA